MAPSLEDTYREQFHRGLEDPLNADDVPDILRFICRRNGYLDANEDAELLASKVPLEVEYKNQILRSRELLARYASDISKSLYDNEFRFFYELLQNAEDAKRSETSRVSNLPCVTFKFSRGKLVVDLTDNVFELKDVFSITSVGESSKSEGEAIGNKGFGFKSVFSIASSVHIQSGIWSFLLQHNHGEDGIGMVAPRLQESKNPPKPGSTRFTIGLKIEESMRQELYEWIEKQPVAMIGFLTKIRKINVVFDDRIGGRKEISLERPHHNGREFRKLVATTDGQSKDYKFYSFSALHNKLQLWFPVNNETSKPLFDNGSGSYTFAFLPIRQVPSLPFIINADFELPANRQNIVANNACNQEIKRQAAILFSIAITSIAETGPPSLQFRWPAFLPGRSMPDTEFWNDLADLIRSELINRKVFISLKGESLNVPANIRSLPDIFLHEGAPILPKSADRRMKYLSQQYQKADLTILRYLGVQELSPSEILDRVLYDLKSASPQVRQKPFHDVWHNAYARLLLWLMEEPEQLDEEDLDEEVDEGREVEYDLHDIISQLRRHAAIPVLTGSSTVWQTATATAPIYFPHLTDFSTSSDPSTRTVCVSMPTDLGLKVVHPDAVINDIRKEMYGLLGAETCDADRVQQAILNAQYESKDTALENRIAHLELLFLYGYQGHHSLIALTMNLELRQSNRLFFYDPDEHIFAKHLKSHEPNVYDEFFLNEKYLDSQVQFSFRYPKPWRTWLEQVGGVRSYPTLNDPDNFEYLHPLVIAIRDHHPKSFLPMLQQYWTSYRASVHSNEKLKAAVRESKVLCQHGRVSLFRRAWFPSAKVLAKVQVFGVRETLPVLELPDSQAGCELLEWPLIRDLGIASDTNVAFYERVLVAMKKLDQVPETLMHDLYSEIGGLDIGPTQVNVLRDYFRRKEYIWDPSCSTWRSSSECVWDSSIDLESKLVLRTTYTGQNIPNLFQNFLQIGDATAQCFISELKTISDDLDTVDIIRRVSEIYQVLKDLSSDEVIKEFIWKSFKSEHLIYAVETWYLSDKCLWHDNLELDPYASIESIYPELKGFFVDVLKVKIVDTKFLIRELVAAATVQSTEAAENREDTIRHLVIETGRTIRDDSDTRAYRDDIKRLKNIPFLPCITLHGSVLLKPSDTFFIADDLEYTEAFRTSNSVLPTLDFDYQELTMLYNFLALLGLEERYLSRHVIVRTDEGQTHLNSELTQHLRDAAYALSCCALKHHSPLYSHESEAIHQLLKNACVYTSSLLQTVYVVSDGKNEYEAPASRGSPTINLTDDFLRIVMPEAEADFALCRRGWLSRALAQILRISGTDAPRQIHRIVNEIGLGTDQILAEENIPHASWLSKTSRNPQSTELEQQHEEDEDVSETLRVSNIAILRELNPIEPPEYGRLLEHLRRRAAGVLSRPSGFQPQLVTIDSGTRYFQDLMDHRSRSISLRDYPEVFGDEDKMKFRIGAAGEFFVFELLRNILGIRIRHEDWQSRIRHFARAHQNYRSISVFQGSETADIVFDDRGYAEELPYDGGPYDENDTLKARFQRQILGDTFDDWLPHWMSGDCTCTESTDGVSDNSSDELDDNLPGFGEDIDNSLDGNSDSNSETSYTPSLSDKAMSEKTDKLCHGCMEVEDEPLIWQFEVKTTLGPCETPFFISPNQYALMRKSGTFNANGRRSVYCIVRIYNLFQHNVGVRIFIDPWRFKDRTLQFTPTGAFRVTQHAD